MATSQRIEIKLGLSKLEYQNDPSSNRQAILILETNKGFRGLRSHATVMWEGQNSRSHAFGIAGGGDFSKTLLQSDKAVKGTQRNIDNQHAKVFTPEKIAEITKEASMYYAETQT